MSYAKMSLDEVLTSWKTGSSPTVCDGDWLFAFAFWGWEYFLFSHCTVDNTVLLSLYHNKRSKHND